MQLAYVIKTAPASLGPCEDHGASHVQGKCLAQSVFGAAASEKQRIKLGILSVQGVRECHLRPPGRMARMWMT